MKKDCLLGLFVVIAAVVVVLAVFCWIDGIPAANLLMLLADMMQ